MSERPIDGLRDAVAYSSRRSFPMFTADEVQTALDEITRLQAERDETRKDARYIALDGQEWKEMYERAKNRYTGAEAANATLREALQDIAHELLRAEVHCPCGARPESPSTHPHVIDCPIDNAIARFESLATPTATAGALDSLIEHERWNSGRVDPTATAREGGEG